MSLQIIGNATGDAIVTTQNASAGTSFARDEDGELPASVTVGFVYSDVPPAQIMEVDIVLNFPCSISSIAASGFTLTAVNINGVAHSTSLSGVVLGGRTTLELFFQNDSDTDDELLRGSLVVAPS